MIFMGKDVSISKYYDPNRELNEDYFYLYNTMLNRDDMSEVSFLRFDSDVFAVSYEGDSKLISVDKAAISIANTFVKELVIPEASEYDYVLQVQRVLDHQFQTPKS